jgi:hypothetical protein
MLFIFDPFRMGSVCYKAKQFGSVLNVIIFFVIGITKKIPTDKTGHPFLQTKAT